VNTEQRGRAAQRIKNWTSPPAGGVVTVGSIRRQHLGHHLIDFASSEPSHGLTFNGHLSVGPLTLTHCTSRPIEGRRLGASQIIVALHDGEAFDMDWREAESDRIRSSTVSHGQAHVGDARVPFWVRCSASPSFFAFGLDVSFVTEIWQKGFDRTGEFAIHTAIGIEDPEIGRLSALGWRELNQGGAGGRLYVEGLAAMLTVHLLGA
jgi:hypothetical protein